jgi:hypothetical protein
MRWLTGAPQSAVIPLAEYRYCTLLARFEYADHRAAIW